MAPQGFDGLRGDWRLRQEHAGLLHGDRAVSNRPAVFVYGGTIRPGCPNGETSTSCRCSKRSASARRGARSTKRELRRRRAHRAIPGPGIVRRNVHGEHDGLGDRGARPESAEQLGAGAPSRRQGEGLRAAPATAVIRMLAARHHCPARFSTAKPSRTRLSLVTIALGGSTNAAVLHPLGHLLRAARRCDLRARRISPASANGVPVLADLKPGKRDAM